MTFVQWKAYWNRLMVMPIRGEESTISRQRSQGHNKVLVHWDPQIILQSEAEALEERRGCTLAKYTEHESHPPCALQLSEPSGCGTTAAKHQLCKQPGNRRDSKLPCLEDTVPRRLAPILTMNLPQIQNETSFSFGLRIKNLLWLN